MSTNQRLGAIRGATTVDSNTPEAIVAATEELLSELLDRNGAGRDQLISLIFTSTPDLTAEFPAAAARRMGLSDVALLCATEIAVPTAVGGCIRVLVHLYTDRQWADLEHVYLRGAKGLRADLDQPEVEP
ncbi:MAG: chorismate mutase [Actinomycetota bacterium]|nr:chorismate mutase [Actinomycetota bacterium]